MIREVGRVRDGGGTLKDAFAATHAALAPAYGDWPIFEHCLPFDVSRLWDELDGVERPRIWTADRDREVWARLQAERPARTPPHGHDRGRRPSVLCEDAAFLSEGAVPQSSARTMTRSSAASVSGAVLSGFSTTP